MSTLRTPLRPEPQLRRGRAEPPLTAAPAPTLRAEPAPQFAPEPEAFEAAAATAAATVARASEALKRPVAASPRPARPASERRDPAPSRLAYRVERLWLTPLFRRFMRYGLPALVVAGAAGLYLASDARRAAIGESVASLRTSFENRPEFMVKYMAIDGASAPVDAAIRQLVTVPLPASSFRLDLEGMRAAIEQIDAVDRVNVKVRTGGILAVTVTERKPAVLWRTEASLEMLDATGHRVATLLDRGARADLPVIAGAGAEEHVPEALRILAAAQPILPRVRGLVRMGDRRWDMVLDRDQTIQLPETAAVEAVERVMAIDTAEELLARDVAMVDLRNPDRPTVRLGRGAVEAMNNIKENVTKVAGQ